MPEMQPIDSSMIASAGYDPETQEFHVQFKKGRTAVYSHVPQDIVNSVLGDPNSVGKAFNSQIVPFYQHRYL